jgi:hypothetical protein
VHKWRDKPAIEQGCGKASLTVGRHILMPNRCSYASRISAVGGTPTRGTGGYPVALHPHEAALLGLPPGGQVIHVVHTAEADDGTVLEVSESIWPVERVAFIDEYPVSQDAADLAALSEI